MQTTSGLVIIPGSGTPNATEFEITNITGGNLFQNDGTTAVPAGSFISVAQGRAGLKFTPSDELRRPGGLHRSKLDLRQSEWADRYAGDRCAHR